MGVIDLYAKVKDIVGSNWDGTTMSDYIRTFPIPKIILQPHDTSDDYIRVETNINGFVYSLQYLNESTGEWVNSSFGTNIISGVNYANVNLQNFTTAHKCRIRLSFGASFVLYTDEFVYTRPAQASAMKMDAQATTDDITVEKEDITPVEKPTTTKSK